jgi:HemY protein
MTTLRTLLWFALIAAAMIGAVWLAERPGDVTIEWHGWRMDTSVGVLLLAVAMIAALCTTLYGVARWLRHAPGSLIGSWGEGRRRKGYRALSQGMVAVAAGDSGEAQKLARQAERLLDEPALTLLLSAQAAQLAGDREAARRYFNEMLEDEELAFLGLRGLLMQALRDGDPAKALGYAERAFALRPDTPWVVRTLFDMQARAGKWLDAQKTLQSGLKSRLVDAERGRALDALLLVERSRAAERSGSDMDAMENAKAAFGLAPERVPVAYRYAELLLKRDEARKATKAIEKTWAVAPHPDLAQLYLSALGEKDPVKRVQALTRLTAANPDELESRIALARECLEANLWGEARRHLTAAGGKRPVVRVCRLMADLEEAEFADGEKVRHWLARAADAPGDRQWRCTACGAVNERWQAVCDSCGAFGTLQWRVPDPTTGEIARDEPPTKAVVVAPAEILPPER